MGYEVGPRHTPQSHRTLTTAAERVNLSLRSRHGLETWIWGTGVMAEVMIAGLLEEGCFPLPILSAPIAEQNAQWNSTSAMGSRPLKQPPGGFVSGPTRTIGEPQT